MEDYWEARAEVLIYALVNLFPDDDPLENLTETHIPDVLHSYIPDHYDGTEEAEIVRTTAVRLLEEMR